MANIYIFHGVLENQFKSTNLDFSPANNCRNVDLSVYLIV